MNFQAPSLKKVITDVAKIISRLIKVSWVIKIAVSDFNLLKTNIISVILAKNLYIYIYV